MDMIPYSLNHGMAKEFACRFRDALFVVDPEDRQRVEAYLQRNNNTWERQFAENSKWILRRVKRSIPPAKDLLSIVESLFKTHGNLLDAKTQAPLFDDRAWKKARSVLTAIANGEVSDPPGIPFYHQVGVDKKGLPLYRCTRGTNSIEGGVHQNVIRKFASFGTSPRFADCALADYRLRHNLDVSSFLAYVDTISLNSFY
jgi:hypothetical protein